MQPAQGLPLCSQRLQQQCHLTRHAALLQFGSTAQHKTTHTCAQAFTLHSFSSSTASRTKTLASSRAVVPGAQPPPLPLQKQQQGLHHQQPHLHQQWQQQQQQQRYRCVIARGSRALPGGLPVAQVAGIIGAVLGLGTLNRVLYRLALVPLRDYVFFLAQAQNIGYIVIYYFLLWVRYRQGKVTDSMLSIPKPLFIVTGCCEAAAQLLMMTGAAHLPGALLPLLMQTVLLWNLVFSSLIFGTRPTLLQILGVVSVLIGVGVASWPAASNGSSAVAAVAAVEPVYLAVCCASFVFPALATIIKEHIFKSAAKQLGGGKQLDVLVVNAYCSTAQAAFLLLLLPLSCQLKGLSLSQLPAYLQAGSACLMGGSPGCGADCAGAPLLPLLYVGVNVAFNVAAMLLVRSLGAVATGLTMSCLVPITVAAFTLPLPLLDPAQLGPHFMAGTGLLMFGLLLFNAGVWLPAALAWVKGWQRSWATRLVDG